MERRRLVDEFDTVDDYFDYMDEQMYARMPYDSRDTPVHYVWGGSDLKCRLCGEESRHPGAAKCHIRMHGVSGF